MPKWKLFKEVLKSTDTANQYNAIITAIESYLSASDNGKPLVSGPLPTETEIETAGEKQLTLGFKIKEYYAEKTFNRSKNKISKQKD